MSTDTPETFRVRAVAGDTAADVANRQEHVDAVAATIRQALALPADEYPERPRRRGELHDDEHVLGQLLAMAQTHFER